MNVLAIDFHTDAVSRAEIAQARDASHQWLPAGVQAYPSWRSGFAATLATLGNGHYPAILSALSAGTSARAVADAVAASPWGTAYFQANC